MKKRIRIMMTVALVLLLTAALPGVSAFADARGEYVLPVKTIVEGGFPQVPENFTIVMEAEDPSYPMPDGAFGGSCVIELSGKDEKDFPVISYDNLGFYTYLVRQLPGNAKNGHYDETVYELVVSVTNSSELENGYEVQVAIMHQGEADKYQEVVFTNKYDYPDNPKTGDSSHMSLYIVLLAMSSAAMFAVVLIPSRKHN